ncbi:MAG: TonB-dependent receptor [Prevotella sp.]|nr:TonB-dependent receptor [Prevotella sp.]
MKQILAILLCIMTAGQAGAQHTVSGHVTDKHHTPLAGANIFIEGTLDGCLTDSLGQFTFTTAQKGTLTLIASSLGYGQRSTRIVLPQSHPLNLELEELATPIDEVVVEGSRFGFGTGDEAGRMNALDVVMTGCSNGDIIAALQSLPGTQKVGESGRLYVRGGESSECQTFINGMHVLMPYTTTTDGSPSRGRFSPFLFKGINFSLGGYGSEYGEALSSVLPMTTTDVSTGDKLGFSVSDVELNLGGTKAFRHNSVAFNAQYDDMGLYNALFPSNIDWNRPYRRLSGEAQYKVDFSPSSSLRTYLGYDYTTVSPRQDDHNLYLREHNLYANATFRTALPNGWSLFAGMANSTVNEQIDGAETAADRYGHRQNELHMKVKSGKSFGSRLHLQMGVEQYFRKFNISHNQPMMAQPACLHLSYQLSAAFAEAQIRLLPKVYGSISGRLEYPSYAHGIRLMPRMALSYQPSRHLHCSLMYGRYAQTAEDQYALRMADKLEPAHADHYIAGLEWLSIKTTFRLEGYYKHYSHLPLRIGPQLYAPAGYGFSRGVDVFFTSIMLRDNLQTTLSYSYNDSKRKYMDYTEAVTPHYATLHNLSLSAKYGIDRLKSYLGITEMIASGRPYTDPTLPGQMNAHAPLSMSLSVNVSVLVSPKVIVYASATNILGHNNIYGYSYTADGSRRPRLASYDRMFFIGIFVSLKNTKAYEISNF